MKKSSLQFTNPILLELCFEANKQFTSDSDHEISIPTNFNINISRSETDSEAIVELTVELGSKEKHMPFYIKAVEGAKFTWDDASILNVSQMLEQNAPALLLGYLRPIIATITSASPFNTYHIPFVDFTK